MEERRKNQGTIHQLESQLRIADHAKHQLDAERAQAELKLSEAEKKLSEAEKKLWESQQKHSEAEQELYELKQRLSEADQKLSYVASQLAEEQNLLQNERLARFKADSDREVLQRAKDSVELELSNEREKVRALEQGEQNLLLQVRAQEEKQDHQDRCIQELQELHKEEKTKVDVKESQVAALQADIAKHKARWAHMEESLNTKEKEVSLKSEEVAVLKRSLSQLQEEQKKQHGDHQDALREHSAVIARKDKEIEKLVAEKKRLESDALAIKEQNEVAISDLKVEMKTLNDNRRELLLKVVDLEVDLKSSKEAQEQLRQKLADSAAKAPLPRSIMATKKKVTFSDENNAEAEAAAKSDQSNPAEASQEQPATPSAKETRTGKNKRKLLVSDESEDDLEMFSVPKLSELDTKKSKRRFFGRTYGSLTSAGSRETAASGSGGRPKRFFKARRYDEDGNIQ